LRYFGMSSCKNIGMNVVCEFMKNNHSIKELNLDFTEVNDYSLQILTDTLKDELESISLKNCSKITHEGLQYMCSNLTQLQSFDVKWTNTFESEALRALISNCPNIKKLKLADNEIDDADIKLVVTKLKNLIKLSLSHVDKNECVSANCYRFREIGPVKNYMVFDNIKWLDVSHNSLMNDDSIKDLARAFPTLEFLNLANCERLTIETLEHLANSKMKRTLIHLNFCVSAVHKYNPKRLRDIFEDFRKLMVVYLKTSNTAEELKEIMRCICVVLN